MPQHAARLRPHCIHSSRSPGGPMELLTSWLHLISSSSQSTHMKNSIAMDSASERACDMLGSGDMVVDPSVNTWWALLYAGVNYSLAGTGGPECVAYITPVHRLLESALIVPICLTALLWAYRRLPVPAARPSPSLVFDAELRAHSGGGGASGDACAKIERCSARLIACTALQPLSPCVLRGPNGRRALLALYCFVLGAELGYKLCSRTAIYLLNPCHVISAAQIAMLAVDDYEPSRHKARNIAYRLHVYAVAGSTLAMAFPVLNTRTRVWSRAVYWAQHWLILVTPIYLESLGGSYVMESQPDLCTAVFAIAALVLYHLVPLQIIGLLTGVNLNNVICPAVSDPFKCRYWRLVCFVHQSLYVPLHTYIFVHVTGRIGGLLGLRPPPAASGSGADADADGDEAKAHRARCNSLVDTLAKIERTTRHNHIAADANHLRCRMNSATTECVS